MADVGLFDNILSMNEKHGKRGQWIGLFYLTLSDISADLLTLVNAILLIISIRKRVDLIHAYGFLVGKKYFNAKPQSTVLKYPFVRPDLATTLWFL